MADLIARYFKEGRIDELFEKNRLIIKGAPRTYEETLASKAKAKEIMSICKHKEDRARVILVTDILDVLDDLPKLLTPEKREAYIGNYDAVIECTLIAIEASRYCTDKKISRIFSDERPRLIEALRSTKELFSGMQHKELYDEVYIYTIRDNFLTKDILSFEAVMELYYEGLIESNDFEGLVIDGYSKIPLDVIIPLYEKGALGAEVFAEILVQKATVEEMIILAKKSTISNEDVIKIFNARFFEMREEEIDSAVKLYSSKIISREQLEDIIKQGYFEYAILEMEDIVRLYKSKKIDEKFMQRTFTPIELHEALIAGEIDSRMFVDFMSEKSLLILHEISKQGGDTSYRQSVARLLEIYKGTGKSVAIQKIPSQILLEHFLSPEEFSRYFKKSDNPPQINISDLCTAKVNIFKLAIEENENHRITQEEFMEMYKKLAEYKTKTIKEEEERKQLLPKEDEIKYLYYEEGFLKGQNMLSLYMLNDKVTGVMPVKLHTLIHIYRNQVPEKEGNIHLQDWEKILDLDTIYNYYKEKGINNDFREFYNKSFPEEFRKRISFAMCEYLKERRNSRKRRRDETI